MLFGKTVVVTGISSGIGSRVGAGGGARGRRDRRRRQGAGAAAFDAFVKADIGSPQGVAEIAESLPSDSTRSATSPAISGCSAREDARDQFLRPAGAERSAGAAAARRRRCRQRRVDRRLRMARESRTGQGLRRPEGLSGSHAPPRGAQCPGRRGLSAVEGALILWTLQAAHIRCSRTAASGSTRSAQARSHPDLPRIPPAVRRRAGRRRHRPGRTAGNAARYRAGRPLPVLRRGALDQRREFAGRWRARSVDTRDRARIVRSALREKWSE